MNFMEKLVTFHESSSSNMVKDFSFDCNVLSGGSLVQRWISVAASHKVQSMDLQLRKIKKRFHLPPHLFTCGTVEKLGIKMSFKLKLPSHICLSSLKKLSLSYVVFPNEHSTQQLFSSCPIMEELRLWNCYWDNVNVVCIDSPMLRRLSIADGMFDEDDRNFTENPERVRSCQILIFAKNLEYLSFSGELRHDYCFRNLFSLEEAELDLWKFHCRSRIDSFRFYQLLRGLSHVTILHLGGEPDIIKVLMGVEELIYHLPIFADLACLIFTGEIDISCKPILNILRNSPYLDTFLFKSRVKLDKSDGQDELILDPVPLCFSRQLESVKFHDFCGHKSEIGAIAFILENAMCLESVCVRFGISDAEDQKLKDLQKELLSLPRGSPDCEMEFWKSYKERLPDFEPTGSEQASC